MSGQTVSGLHVTNPNGPCITGVSVTNVRITNNRIGPCGPGATGVGIDLRVSSAARIDHNLFDDVATSLYALEGTNDIVFEQNLTTRIRGPLPRGQMVQFDKVRGSGHKIQCNVSDQTTPGTGAGPEDHISIFNSGGTAGSPIDIAYNKLRGGGPSQSGGGIVAGDYGSDHVVVRDNILVHPGQYGIAIAGGQNLSYLRNRVYSRTVFPWSNIGLYVWAQSAGTCSGHEVRGNHVFYLDRNGSPNPYWNAQNCGAIAGENDNIWEWNTSTTLTESIWNEPIAACNESVPAAPSGLTAILSRSFAPANLALAWTDNATNESQVVVERAVPGGSYALIATLAADANAYSDPNRPAGSWSYRVKATHPGGDSAYSNIATVTISQAPDTSPPTVPTGLSATVVSATRIDLSWTASTDNVGVAGYVLYRCQGAGCTPSSPFASAAATTFSDTGLAPATTYRYAVAAHDVAGNQSAKSATITQTTLAAPPAPPAAPGGLAAALSSTTAPVNVTLTWNDNASDETSLVVERAAAGAAFATIATLAANTVAHADANRPAGAWNYRVKARNAAGDSAYSNTASVAIVAPEQITGTLLPVANGSYQAWSGSSFTAVDDSVCDGASTYASTSIVGRRVSYRVDLSAVPDGATITRIVIIACAARHFTGSGSTTMNVFHRWNGVNSADAGAFALTGTTPAELAPTTFGSLALAKTAASTLQIGAIYSAGTRGARLSRIGAIVSYIAP